MTQSHQSFNADSSNSGASNTNEQPRLAPGRYRHYKGNDYQVLGLVQHSETEEWLVHYRTLYGNQSEWVRPYDMFVEQVEVDGEPVARFEYQGPASETNSNGEPS